MFLHRSGKSNRVRLNGNQPTATAQVNLDGTAKDVHACRMQRQRKQVASSRVLPRHIAEELAAVAGCHWRTVMAAAEGKRVVGEGGARAMNVVSDHFDLNPSMRPTGWKRPAHSPLSYTAAATIAQITGASIGVVQRIASGIPSYDELGTKVAAELRVYYELHPEDKPVPMGTTS